MKELKNIFSALTLCLGLVATLSSCSDNDDQPSVADISGTYSGYTLAGCADFSDMCTANETVTITANADGSANVTFTSDTWGDFTITAQMSYNSGVYTLTGSGSTEMSGHGSTTSYDCTYTATIYSQENAQMEFYVASVMQGLTIDFVTGDAPADLLLAGTYSGYTDASSTYFSGYYTDGESLTVTANGDGTVAVVFESQTWGTFNVADATITKDGDEYTLEGSGTVSMSMGSSSATERTFQMTGTVTADKETYSFSFTVSVMGTTTITLLPGTAPSTDE